MSTYNDASLIYYPSGYKAGTAYSLKPTDGSGDLTFTRASTATRVNESGLIESVATGVPRIDYTGGGCGKLLLEPQRTNLISQSINFASWSRIGTPTVTSNYGISPSGIQDSTRVQGINGDRLYLAVIGSSATYSYSIYVKGSGLLSITDSTGTYSLIITPTSNWVRHTLNFTAAFTNVQIRTLTVSDLEIYGAQIESGAYPTSLINTSGTAVTRVKDIAIKTGISLLIGQTEGTLFIDADVTNFSEAAQSFITISDGTINNRIELRKGSPSNILLEGAASTGTFPNINLTSAAVGRYKIAAAYKTGNTVVFINGVQIGSTSTNAFAFGSLTDVVIGGNFSGSTRFLNDRISQALLFTTRLDNATLATLTTL